MKDGDVRLRGFLICVFFAVTSTTISLVNKLLLTQYDFRGHFLLLAFQLVGALLAIGVFKLCHRVGVFTEIVPNVPPLDMVKYKRSLMASVLFVGNVGCAFVGLRIVDVPLFLCVRRVTTVCVLVTEYLMLGKVASNKILSAVGLIMLGTVLAGYETLSANFVGYAFVMGNNILTAMLYTEQKKLGDVTGLQSFGLLYYNAVTALPLCLCIAYYLGEFDLLASFPYVGDTTWITWMSVSSMLGVVMTYATVLCNSVNSPLATSVTGNTKDIISTAIGWAVFGGFIATFWSVTGLLVSFVGSGWYSYIKLFERSPAAAPAVAVLPSAAVAVNVSPVQHTKTDAER